MIIVDGVKAENVSVYSDGSLFIEITLEKILHDHVFDQKVINEDTLKSQADCLTPDVYYYSCICGDISENDTFEVNSPLEHIFKDDCDTLCDREGCEYLRRAQHVFSTDYKNHENGHSEYCVKCDQELDLEEHEYKFGKCKICGFKDPDTIIPMVITASVAVVILSVAAIIIILIIKKKKSVNK